MDNKPIETNRSDRSLFKKNMKTGIAKVENSSCRHQ
jgi:hypothetical protein